MTIDRSDRSAISTLVRKELTELRADRKAIFMSLLLPVLIYPVMFYVMSRADSSHEGDVARSVYPVVVSGPSTALREAIDAHDGLELSDVDPEVLPSDLQRDLSHGQIQAWVDAPDGISSPGAADPTEIELVYRGTRDQSKEAADRIESALDSLHAAERQRRYERLGRTDVLDDAITLSRIDIATAAEASGAEAGRFLIYFLVMSLFMSGSALATDMVAGEKERGTLETLYLVPLNRNLIARAKYIVVIAGVTLSGVLSLGSIVFCYRMGWVNDSHGTSALPASSVLAAAALIVPLAVLIGGVLLAISAYARSLKEAQYLVMPAMLLTFVPGLLAMSQAVELNPMVAMIPVANVAFAMRDVIGGRYDLGLVMLSSAVSLGWGLLTLRWVSSLLSREEMVLGFDPEPLFGKTKGGRRRALWLSMSLTVLAYFYFGQMLQTRWLLRGLAASLWGLLPVFGILTLRFAGSGGTVRDLLSLRRPTAGAMLGATMLAFGSLLPMYGGLMELQAKFLPSPQSATEALQALFGDTSLGTMLFLAAVSPAICEELLFRGVFLGLARRVDSNRVAVIATAFFFGLIHLSLFRFVPTMLLGLILGWITVRGRSIFPAMVFHLLYNGTLLAGAELLADRAPPIDLQGPLAWTLSLLLLAAGAALLARSPGVDRRPLAPV